MEFKSSYGIQIEDHFRLFYFSNSETKEIHHCTIFMPKIGHFNLELRKTY